MRFSNLEPVPLTLITSLMVAVLLLAIRVFVMQRVQQRRQRENRQESERLRSLVSAYRSLAGSFSPGAETDRMQVEEALSDIVLFGSLRQVTLAAQCANALVNGQPVDFQALVHVLRADLRIQLGLDPIPSNLELPAAGPGRPNRGGRGEGEGGRRGERGGGGGGAGGFGGAAAGFGGLGAGIAAGDDDIHDGH